MLRRTILLFLLFFIYTNSPFVQAQTVSPTPEKDFHPAPDSAKKTIDKKDFETESNMGQATPAQITNQKESVKISDVNHRPAQTNRININLVGVDPNQTISLSLNDAIRRALENNNDIEVARNDVRINETTLRSIQGFYDPVFSVSPAFSRVARTGSTSSNNFQINSGVSQELQIGGARIEPFFNNSRNGSGSQFVDPTIPRSSNFFYSSNLGISYTQPLWRNRSIDNTRRNIRIQRKRLEQSDADFRRRTIETIATVQRAYWDLVFALRDQQNRVDNLNLTKENMRRVEAQIAAGAAAPLARAEVATELANRESDLLVAAQQVAIADNSLKQLLLKDSTAPEWTTQFVPTDEPSFDPTPINLTDSLAEAKQNRPELQRLNLQREINDIDVRFFKNQTRPRIDLNTTFSLIGIAQSFGNTVSSGTTSFPLIVAGNPTSADSYLLDQINRVRRNLNPPLPDITQSDVPTVNGTTPPNFFTGGFNQSLQNLFRSDAPNLTVGVTFSFPLRNRTAKANLAGAQIQRTQLEAQTRLQEQAVVAEVRNAVQAVETARQRIDAARAARENAEIQLRGEQKLYEVGRSNTFILFQRQNALANARNLEIRSQTDYNKAIAELQRATSTTLRSNSVIVESVVSR